MTQPDQRLSRTPLREPTDGHLVQRTPRISVASDPFISRSRQAVLRERITIMQGLALWLCSINWPVDIPPTDGQRLSAPTEIPQWWDQLFEEVPARLYENVFWGLTTDDIFQDRQYAGTLIGFTTEGSQIDLRSRMGANQQSSLVRVLVESAPLVASEMAAMRLWGLFLEQVGFTVNSGLIDTTTGERLPVQQPDFAVQAVRPIDEPQLLGETSTGRVQFTFRLQTKYVRFF